jgi:hypothetical protein
MMLMQLVEDLKLRAGGRFSRIRLVVGDSRSAALACLLVLPLSLAACAPAQSGDGGSRLALVA